MTCENSVRIATTVVRVSDVVDTPWFRAFFFFGFNSLNKRTAISGYDFKFKIKQTPF
jgi:hypothetical protein